jgi:thiamine kinase-like enzyme
MKDQEFVKRITRQLKSSLCDRFVEESDVANIELQKLPIRIGCSAVGGCCCTGNCRRIVGEISREKYEQTINAVKTMSKEEFDKEIERIYFEYRKE